MGSSVKIGYYRQTHDGINLDQTVVRYLQGVILKEAPQQAMSEQQARDLAGAFLFGGTEQEKMLYSMSGGERSRAVLAGLLASAKNLLVLDEPTNHLDIPSAERLEEALGMEGGFDGTLILISHDRALIDHTCNQLLVLDGKGGAEIFAGTYSEWHIKDMERKKLAAREADEARLKKEEGDRQRRLGEDRKKQQTQQKSGGGVGGSGGSGGGGTAVTGEKNKGSGTTKYERMKTEQIETKIDQIQARIKSIDVELQNSWRDTKKANTLGDERAKLAAELEPLEFEWLRRTG